MQQWGNSGPVLVFIHYFGGAALSWQWVAEQLSSDHQCIALNLPGFGGTDPLDEPSIENFAQYIQQETDRLHVASFTLVGHSMGGKLAVQAAAADTERRINQLVLVAPSPPTTEDMPDEEKKRMLRHPDRAEAETTVQNATYQKLSPECHTLAVQTQLEIESNTWRWWLLDGMNHSIADQVPQVNVPVTVLASEDDSVIDPDAIRQEVMGVIPHAQLRKTRGVGHLIPQEDPTWVAEQIRQVVSSQE